MPLIRRHLPNLIKLTLLTVVAYLLFKILFVPLLTSQKFIDFTSSLGVWGYFIVMGYTILSHVFAPIAGSPGVILGVTIYGLKTGLILLYVASMVSAVINFYLSRRFGRALVKKLVGSKAIKEIDEFASIEGKRFIWISRLLGISIFDFISYAAGLTSITFKSYMAITAISTIFANLFSYFIFSRVDFRSEQGILFWYGSLALVGIFFGAYIKVYIKRQYKNN